MTVLIVLETVVLVVLSVLVVGLLRSYATVLDRLHRLDGGEQGEAGVSAVRPEFRTVDGVPPPASSAGRAAAGTTDAGRSSVAGVGADREQWAAAHDVSGEGLFGEIVSVRTVGVDHDTVVVFLSSGCSGCTTFWEQLSDRGGVAAVGNARVLVVTKSPQDESIGLLRELRPAGVDLIMSSQAWADYAVPGSPYVIVVDGVSGRIKGEGSGTSLTQVSGLMRQAYGDGASAPALRSVRKPRSDTEREVDVDRALLAAGIGPGHPSLYADGTAHPATAQRTHRLLDLTEAHGGAPQHHQRQGVG